jgi:mannose-1-phosphate guanylyltransferase
MAIGSPWAVILAGGDGTRLRTLTRHLAGDDRPKQFCRLVGAHSLLTDTIQRVAPVVGRDRTLCVVSKQHEPFYRGDLKGLRPWQILEQPANRGTTAAVAYGVASLVTGARRWEQPIVACIPADHYYTDAKAFRRALNLAYAVAADHADRVVILGAGATTPETDFGWIQPGASLDGRRSGGAVREVVQFWEKPTGEVAASLMARRCLWNTFLTVGRASAFASLLADTVPEVWSAFSSLGRPCGQRQGLETIEAIYDALDASDFSRDVLTERPGRLVVIDLPAAAGWTDLGHPERALDVRARHNLPRPTLRWAAGETRATGGLVPLDAA